MKRTLTLAVLLALQGATIAPARKTTLKDLDDLVGRWIGLRTTLAQEQRAWDAREQQWNAEIELLKQESLTLDGQIEKYCGAASEEEQKRARLLGRKTAMNEELKQLEHRLSRAEAELLQWKVWIPESLLQPLESQFKALPKNADEADKLGTTKRVQTLVSLFIQIENLQHDLHTTREMLEADQGKRRQVDVIYIGLSRAFAVSLNNDWAAVGIPAAGGWSWSAIPEHALSVRSAIDVLNRQKPAELVHLPMKPAEGVTP